MVAFARSKTKSLISRLWPSKTKFLENNIVEIKLDNENIEKQSDHREQFLQAIKGGGVWFS